MGEDNNYDNEVNDSIESGSGSDIGSGAIRRGISAAGKKFKDNTKNAIKEVWKRLPVKERLIVLAVIVAICIGFFLLCAVTLYILELENDNANTQEEFNSVSTEDNTDITSEDLQISKENLQEYINNYSTEHEDLRTVMLGKTSDIIQWQTDYGYSAKLFVTVAFEEYPEEEENVPGGNAPEGDTPEAEDTTSKAETYFLEFLTNMNDQASTWKQNTYTTIQEIAKSYVGEDDESYIEWANNIQNKM